MSFRSVFIAISVSFAFILIAFLVQRARPRVEVDRPGVAFVKASGKCSQTLQLHCSVASLCGRPGICFAFRD